MSTDSVKIPVGDVGGGADVPAFTRRDIQQIERAACRSEPITAQDRRKSIDMLRSIIENEKCPRRTRITAVRAMVALEAIDVRDVHHTERMQHESGILDLRQRRAEEGKPNDCIAIQIAPVRELPLPKSLLEYRRRILEPGMS